MRELDPHDAALGLLSAILLDPSTIPAIETTVMPGDFDRADHADLFQLLTDMHRAGESIRDAALVMSRVRQSGLLDRLGGPRQFQADFLNDHAHENATHYAAHVRQHSVRRKLVSLAEKFSRRAPSAEGPQAVAEWMRHELAAIESMAATGDRACTIGEACSGLLSDIRETLDSGASPGLLTGIDHIDDTYGGIFPSRLYVVAARPGIGKSSLSQQIGEHIAGTNAGSLFVSLEMSREEIASRYLAKRTGINGKYIASHAVNANDLNAIALATENAMGVPFHISEPTGRRSTVEAICAEARVQKSINNIRVLLVDYVQIIEPSHSKQTEYEKVTMATRAFKQLARELRIPVVLLSQLSRKGEDGKDGARLPRLSDLRSSGSIEQDADGVMFLHQCGANNVRLIVAKMRAAERSEETIRFDGPTCQFKSLPIEDHPNYDNTLGEYAT